MIFDDSSVDDQALRYSYIEFFRQTLSCSTQYYTIFSIFSKQHICTYFYFILLLLKRTECRGIIWLLLFIVHCLSIFLTGPTVFPPPTSIWNSCFTKRNDMANKVYFIHETREGQDIHFWVPIQYITK